MSDKFFGGPFFYENSIISGALLVTVLLLGLVPVIFDVSSLFLLNPSMMLEQNQWWRLVTGFLVTTNPDILCLLVYLLYVGRAYEAASGRWACANLLLIAALVSCGIASALCFWSYYRSYYIPQYAFGLGAAFGTASILTNKGKWQAPVFSKLMIYNSTGTYVALVMAFLNRFALESALFTAGGMLAGFLVAKKVPPFYMCCKCSHRRTAHDVDAATNLVETTTESILQ
ncbi:hypothetical protein GL50803_0015244 [Giardia duodenalis]|uniref:Uncharacterized protein n=2 Tax=Giardia intestinalis TaxID=5741 RepID=A8BJU4_GIAIC|nr:hypothetical protein GL50803_0015244 [Giardia intestinalis]ESU36842.1 Hypothetical protein DHA2_15244 [Giardia intestinalis]KAE8303953.1 hypothetical protein GL50803_0015244 [Giardia intestinalis]|eukprot:XP_001706656.1 Hypothetical protein GL50803_15244 [Giardia lamblia ATCC 50803]